MISIVANGLVIAGACVLALALIPTRRVITQLPQGGVRRSWQILTGLILFFIMGYINYAIFNRENYNKVSDLLVPSIFFFGALFVFIANTLSLQTAFVVKRISTLEVENITDSLMGINNRRYFDRRLDEEFARARRYGLPLSILLLDIDHFKKINDTFGHQVGDTILSNIGRLITESVRSEDVVARYGGEEIVVITPSTSYLPASALAERLRQIIETTAMADTEGFQAGRVTVSIGISTLSQECIDAYGLIERADKALYQAKREGRNRVVGKKDRNE